MATRKPFVPFLDVAREKAKEGVFGMPMLKILHKGALHEGPWHGPLIATMQIQLQGFHPNRYYRAKYDLTQFSVCIPADVGQEEAHRIGEVFMDLINALRVGD